MSTQSLRWKPEETVALIEACHQYRVLYSVADEPFNAEATWPTFMHLVLPLVKWPEGCPARDVALCVSKIRTLSTLWNTLGSMKSVVREKLKQTRLFAPPSKLSKRDAAVITSSAEEDSSTDHESVASSTESTSECAADAHVQSPLPRDIGDLPDASPNRSPRPHDAQMSPPTDDPDLVVLDEPPPSKRPKSTLSVCEVQVTIDTLTAALSEDAARLNECFEALTRTRNEYTALMAIKTARTNELTKFTQLQFLMEHLLPDA